MKYLWLSAVLLTACSSGSSLQYRTVPDSKYLISCQDTPHYCFRRADFLCGSRLNVLGLSLQEGDAQVLVSCR